ncbi:MAG: hypothetical protein ACI4EY_05410 [Lachnospiraceae bacterium]
MKELASFMAKVLAAFAHYYNYKHHRIGYVFQDRFESWDIFDDVDEDMEKNNMRIAKEILAEYKWKYNLREEFEKTPVPML